MAFKGNKIKDFKKFLNEGKSKEEAAKLAGIMKTTMQINYRAWLKERNNEDTDEPAVIVTEE